MLGVLAGAVFFFFLQGGGLSIMPTSPMDGDEAGVSLVEDAALAKGRLADRYPELDRLEGRRGKRANKVIRLQLYERDLRDLALAALARRPEGVRVLQMCEALRTEIDDGEIGVELVLDLDSIPRDQLDEKERRAVERVLDFLPAIGEQELPVGFYGSPEAREGRIRLGGSPRVKLSILKLSLDTLSERLGIPADELEDSLELEWPGFEVLEVSSGADWLELAVRPV